MLFIFPYFQLRQCTYIYGSKCNLFELGAPDTIFNLIMLFMSPCFQNYVDLDIFMLINRMS